MQILIRKVTPISSLAYVPRVACAIYSLPGGLQWEINIYDKNKKVYKSYMRNIWKRVKLKYIDKYTRIYLE